MESALGLLCFLYVCKFIVIWPAPMRGSFYSRPVTGADRFCSFPLSELDRH